VRREWGIKVHFRCFGRLTIWSISGIYFIV